MIVESQFKPAWWMKNRHIQTIVPRLYRRKHTLATIAETVITPDEDELHINWTALPPTDTDKPIVIVFHGLEGSVDSFYAKGMLAAIKACGWYGVLMHFRGCSGVVNKQARAYHSGETADPTFFIDHIQTRFPDAPLCALGFSLGGNVLAKYLGERQAQAKLMAAAVISAPLRLMGCAKVIGEGFSRVYQKYLLDMMKMSALRKLKYLGDKHPLPVSEAQIKQLNTLRGFDELITAPLHGFASASDYYERASAMPVLKNITTPTLFVHAADDPFMDQHVIPKATEVSPAVRFELSQQGGHVGFLSGNNPLKPTFWLEQRIPAFFKEHMR